MRINPSIFRNYDIRGIVGQDLDEEKVEAIGRAYGTFLRRRKIRQAVVGRDCRLSSESYQEAVMKGMTDTGIDIIDIGMVMTQMVYYGQYRFQANGGVMLTGSHNPSNYNGFKLATGYSKTTQPEDLDEIKETIEKEDYCRTGKKGVIKKAALTEDYYNDVLKRVNISRSSKVLVDASTGTAGIFVPEILRRAGCQVVGRNLEPDGAFPLGTPDPTAERIMKRVAGEVLEVKADIGFSFDGDGDRLGVIDERGRILWNDVLVAVFAQEILGRFPGAKIIYNTLCSRLVSQIIKKNRGIPIIWRTGHSFIKSKIAEEKAAFGGELSGHFFFADNAYGYDDGSYSALRLLEYLSEKNMSLAELCDTFPFYFSSPEIKIGCPDAQKAAVIKSLSGKFKNDFPDAEITDDTVIPGDDGIRADFEDGMLVFRYSQNGPYITIKFEAKDKEVYEQRKKYVKKMLKTYPEIIWQDELAVNLEALD